jgi:hypothetical protein
MKNLPKILIRVVFLPLVFVLLFLMPIEFVVSSWQLASLDRQVDGTIISARVTSGPKLGKRSEIKYSYVVNGVTHNSTRVSVGFLSGFESGGGDLAENLSAGDVVRVNYSSSDSGFSVISYGWPKRTIGFSFFVWGIIIQAWVGCRKIISFILGYSFSTIGVFCFFFSPIRMVMADVHTLLLVFGCVLLFWAVVYFIKNRNQSSR